MRILVVEDETVVQLHLCRILEELGHTVVGCATTGAEALVLAAAEHPPEIVLMDVRIPGDLDGVETARELRARHGVAVVFVTAYADETTVARIEAVGAAGFVVKPFRPAEIRVALSTAIRGHEALHRLEGRARWLTSILGGVGDAIVVVDPQGRIAHWTPRAAALTGQDEEAALGKDVHGVLRCVRPADAASLRQALERSLGTARPEVLSEVDLVGAGGGTRAVRGETTPLVDEHGALEGLVLVLREASRAGRGGARPAAANGGAPARRGHSTGKRVLIYSHDTLGLGHLQRSLNLSRAMLRRNPRLSILLATGSPVAHRFPLPPGADYVKLPAVKKVALERYAARSLEIPDQDIQTMRTNLLLGTVRDFAPDVLLVDHAPTGMRGEMLPALEWLDAHTDCVKVLGLRDIIDEPTSVIETWQRQGLYEVLENLYDHVPIYGMREVFDPPAAYRFPACVAAKAPFVGYVVDGETPEPASKESFFGSLPRPLVVVTIGGGDGGAETVVGNWLEMLRQFRSRVNFWSVVLTGPLVPAPLAAELAARAQGLPVTLRDFVPSARPYVRRADLVVCTAGYNTMTEVLALAPRALVIPRIMHRQEQVLRAERLAAMGLVETLHPESVDPERLFHAATRLLADARAPLSEGRAQERIRFEGAERLAELCDAAAGLALTDAGGNE